MAFIPSMHLFFLCAFLLHRLLFVAAGHTPLRSSSSHNPDIAPLLAFKRFLSRPTSTELSSWDPATDPCSSWRGVTCRGGRVARLVLEDLRLDGPIDHLARLPGLALLSLTNNSFSSPLYRLDLSRSPWRAHLKILHLSHNRFSGPFPEDLLSLRRLRRLDLAGNLISGPIPLEIGLLLRRLLTLRLEKNELSGVVPFSMGSIPELTDLNVSHNRLEGKIPGELSRFPLSSFAANPGLCGPPLRRRCSNNFTVIGGVRMPTHRTNGRNIRKWVVAIAAATAAISAAIAASVAALWCLKRRAKKRKERKSEDSGERVKEEEEEEEEETEVAERGGRMEWFEEGHGAFALDDLMRGSAEMLGRGAVGSTYRVVMEGREAPVAVVVKRVRRRKEKRRKKEEEAEEELLREMGRWRHPNVVRLRAYHHSSAGEELLLVYDYLPNGSLYNLLHGLYTHSHSKFTSVNFVLAAIIYILIT